MKQKLNSVDLASWAIFTEMYKDNQFLDVIKKMDLQVFYFLQEYKKEREKGK